jgi:hypothetical protein
MAETVSVLLTLNSVITGRFDDQAGQMAGFAFAARQLPGAGSADTIEQSSHISSTPAAAGPVAGRFVQVGSVSEWPVCR